MREATMKLAERVVEAMLREDRATRSLGMKLVSVEAGAMSRRAGQCGEQVTRPHVLGAQRHTGDAQIGDDAGRM